MAPSYIRKLDMPWRLPESPEPSTELIWGPKKHLNSSLSLQSAFEFPDVLLNVVYYIGMGKF
jgi:hypothetical protein